MTWLDRTLQHWRIHKARPFLPAGARVLDVGSADGALFKAVPKLGQGCLGVDPTLKAPVSGPNYRLLPGFFPADLPAVEPFDAITMLAVLEHFPEHAHRGIAAGCARFLRRGGRLVITVPSPRVDDILGWLKRFRLIDGMSLEEHHAYDIGLTNRIFCPPDFSLELHRPFQFGLNHLFVFQRER